MERRTAAAIGLLVFVCCAYFFGGGGWNQNAHFALTRAIVERQTLAIDAYRGGTNDVSFSRGRVYANKAPGVSFFAAVPYAVVHAVERAAGIDTAAASAVTLNAWICTALICGGSAALIAVVLFLAAASRGLPRGRSALVAIVAVVGTPVLPYSTMLYAHVPSALLLLVAFLLARSERISRVAWGGFAGGLAVLTNYLCAPAVALIALFHFHRRLRPGFFFAAGALPPLALLAAYQFAAFGSLFTTAIDTMDARFVDEGAFMGVFRLPTLEAAWGITFSPYRGLFFLSPFLLLAIPAAVRWWHRDRRSVVAIGAIAVFFVLANASFNGWHGGWGIGPRYLIPIIPLLSLLIALEPLTRVARMLAGVSVAICVLVTAVDPQPPHGYANPLMDVEIPLLLEGEVGVKRQTMEEIAPMEKYPAGSPEAEWASFNAGEVLVDGPLSLVPVILWLLAGGAWILRRATAIDPVRTRELSQRAG